MWWCSYHCVWRTEGLSSFENGNNTKHQHAFSVVCTINRYYRIILWQIGSKHC
jgi:hypothetical protein